MLTATVLHMRFKESHGIDRSQCYKLGFSGDEEGSNCGRRNYRAKFDCQSALRLTHSVFGFRCD